MSSLPNVRPDVLPSAWIDRLFARFTAYYGSQKVGAMWVDADMAEVKAVWAAQLARFEPQSIATALQRLAESGSQWPPTLPEFAETCRVASLERGREPPDLMRLPSSSTPTERTQARENLERAATDAIERSHLDPLSWARRPKGAVAVRLLAKGATTNLRLREILLEHVDDGGTQCRSDEAVRALLQLIESGVVDRIRASELQEAA